MTADSSAPATRWRVQLWWQDSEGVEHPHGHIDFTDETQARGYRPPLSRYIRADLQRNDRPPGTPWTTVERGDYVTERKEAG